MYSKPLAISLSIMVLLSFDIFAQTPWEIDKAEDDIIIYTRVEQDSDFKSFKATMNAEASMADIIEILKNADDYTKWYGYTKTAKVLKQEKGVQYNYVETKFPWPFTNRDMVYKMSIDTIDQGLIKISLEGIPDYIQEKKGIVRMKKASGYLLLQSLADHTAVTYVFHSEPGDNLPIWLANNSIAELPFKTLHGLRTMIKAAN